MNDTRKRIMEAKRADSQGFGIDQLNTLQTFEVPWVGWLVGWLVEK